MPARGHGMVWLARKLPRNIEKTSMVYLHEEANEVHVGQRQLAVQEGKDCLDAVAAGDHLPQERAFGNTLHNAAPHHLVRVSLIGGRLAYSDASAILSRIRLTLSPSSQSAVRDTGVLELMGRTMSVIQKHADFSIAAACARASHLFSNRPNQKRLRS
jgi:hypothetical protein